jgi:hypothetical protein
MYLMSAKQGRSLQGASGVEGFIEELSNKAEALNISNQLFYWLGLP